MRAPGIAILLLAAGCARSEAEWRADLTRPSSEPFERGLAAIALAEMPAQDTTGVPTTLLAVLDSPASPLQARAGELLRGLGPSACEEMAFCLVNNAFFSEGSRAALEEALVRNGAAAVPHLLAVLPAARGSRSERVERVIAAIGEPAVEPLRSLARSDPSSPAAGILVRCALLRLRGADPEERARLLDEVVALGEPAVPGLREALSSSSKQQSQFARDALLALGALDR